MKDQFIDDVDSPIQNVFYTVILTDNWMKWSRIILIHNIPLPVPIPAPFINLPSLDEITLLSRWTIWLICVWIQFGIAPSLVWFGTGQFSSSTWSDWSDSRDLELMDRVSYFVPCFKFLMCFVTETENLCAYVEDLLAKFWNYWILFQILTMFWSSWTTGFGSLKFWVAIYSVTCAYEEGHSDAKHRWNIEYCFILWLCFEFWCVYDWNWKLSSQDLHMLTRKDIRLTSLNYWIMPHMQTMSSEYVLKREVWKVSQVHNAGRKWWTLCALCFK